MQSAVHDVSIQSTESEECAAARPHVAVAGRGHYGDSRCYCNGFWQLYTSLEELKSLGDLRTTAHSQAWMMADLEICNVQLQSRMVQSLVEDVSGTVGKAKESMALKADDQPMSPDAAASLIQEVVNKASASVSTLMRSSPDAATPDSSPRGEHQRGSDLVMSRCCVSSTCCTAELRIARLSGTFNAFCNELCMVTPLLRCCHCRFQSPRWASA